jgi:hypothetical protein
MITTLIFDLSEVLIAGLIGIEKPLAEKLQTPEEVVLSAFGGKLLEDLCRGKISEKHYLTKIIELQGWNISIQTLKTLIRENLGRRIPGMVEILQQLKPQYQLILLSVSGNLRCADLLLRERQNQGGTRRFPYTPYGDRPQSGGMSLDR